MQLSIITLGHVHAEDLEPLTHHFTKLEQLVLDIHPRHPLSQHRAEFNRAVDAASADWILILREREKISADLAGEVATAAKEAKAWGFRARLEVLYAGKPLKLRTGGGEVRLFHKRHYMRFANKGEWDELMIQGTIVWLRNPLHAVSFESVEAHHETLAKTHVPHSGLRRVLLFLRNAAGNRTLDRSTLRYIWTEAGFDKT